MSALQRISQLLTTTLAAIVLAPTIAFGAVVTYDYSVLTPTFDDPPFAALNTLLAGAGTHITGTISFDPAINSGPSGANTTYGSTQFTHSGELDNLFTGDATSFLANTATNTPFSLSSWYTNGDPQYVFGLIFGFSAQVAQCLSDDDLCDGEPVQSGAVSSQFTITAVAVPTVPLPPTLGLFSLGLVGLLLYRSRKLIQR